MAAGFILVGDPGERFRRRGRRRLIDRALPAGRALAGTYRRDSPRAFAGAQLWARRQQQLRVDQDVAFCDLTVRIREELDVPLSTRALDGRRPGSENSLRIPAHRRTSV